MGNGDGDRPMSNRGAVLVAVAVVVVVALLAWLAPGVVFGPA